METLNIINTGSIIKLKIALKSTFIHIHYGSTVYVHVHMYTEMFSICIVHKSLDTG